MAQKRLSPGACDAEARKIVLERKFDFSTKSPDGSPPEARSEQALTTVLPGVRCEASAAPIVQRAFDELARHAYALQGSRAFESTERATAVHEAGHAVVATACGHVVSRVRINRKRIGEQKAWVGRINTNVVLSTGPASKVSDDRDVARNLVAGVLAEQMFDGDDFRLGSSINEIVFFQCVVENIAFKTLIAFEKIALQLIAEVDVILYQHRDLVELLAAKLMRRGTLRGQALSRLLRAVKPLADLYQVELLEKYQGAVRS